jgi:predicted RNA-binding protein with PUA-like domain
VSYFLAKTEPSVYSIDDLARDRETIWDGIKNPQALKALRAMQPGDKVLIYHSGGESQIVGVAQVTDHPRPDPKDEKSWVVGLRFVSKLEAPVSLRTIKESGEFDDFALVRQSRLSTMEVPDRFVQWLRAHGTDKL